METSSRSEIIAQHVRHHVSGHSADEEPQGWRRMPEIPLAHELMSDHPPVLPQVDTANPMSKTAYLESQYRLHRYEATEMLRRAIAQYRSNPAMAEGDDAFIYTQVRVRGYTPSRRGAACRITFSPQKPPASQSDRLMPGSLVALAPESDAFRSKCFVATVASRDADDDAALLPVVALFWADEADAVIDPTLDMVMLEPKGGYFEPIRHTMVGLQHAASFSSRFDRYMFQPCQRHKEAFYLRETPTNSAVVPPNAKHLDPSQLDALKQSTTQELAVVQGPPGTGKTFTSVVAIESYVRTLQLCHEGRLEAADAVPPVIIAAQTNHAVDQLLARCMELGIGAITRLGAGSEDEKINQHSLHNVTHRSKATRPHGRAEASHKDLKQHLREAIRKCSRAGLVDADELEEKGLITAHQHSSLVEDDWEAAEPEEATGQPQNAVARWLDDHVHQRAKHSAPDARAPDADRDFFPIEMSRPDSILGALQHHDGAWWHKAERLLARNPDLYRIKPADRGAVYCYLFKKMFDTVTADVQELLGRFRESCDRLKMARWENQIRAMDAAGIRILGCTTTGLVKYRGLVAALKPRVLLVEEAAEAREANIAAALFPSLEQLVLVGDHQQLVPHVDMRELCLEPHRLNVSLFERLVKNKVPYCALRVQRRMIPALRRVVQVFYPNLEDHAVVENPECRPPVPGMGGRNLWWFQHEWTQSCGSGGFSYSNPREADMIVGFAKYLVQNGVSPGRITVLAYYNGQVDLIKARLKRSLDVGGVEWSVRTIDGFQGEENDIVLLSLVRGPDGRGGRAKPGFVADENRAVVATSRARCGLYIFGNARNVLEGNGRSRKTWEGVFRALEGCTGSTLPVTCVTHGNVTHISQPEDWKSVSAGGCRGRCNQKCPNGHGCTAPCHGATGGHARCKDGCPKTVAACGHGCGAPCGQRCRCSQGCGKGQAAAGEAAAGEAAATSRSTTPKSERGPTPSRRGGEATGKNSPAKAAAGGRIVGFPTSDELLEKGMRSFLDGDRPAEEVCKSDATDSDEEEEPLITLTPTKEGRGGRGKGLADRWGPETVLQKEAELRQARAEDGRGKAGQTWIHETFSRTTVDEGGVRRVVEAKPGRT